MPVFDPFSSSDAVQGGAVFALDDDAIGLPAGNFLLNSASFAQSLGAELLTNGNFAAWTGDNPNSWTVSGESGSDPEISEVASNEGHGGSGTGACNFFSSATANQPRIIQSVFSAGGFYEVVFNLSTLVAGSIGFRAADFPPTANNFASVGQRRTMGRAISADLNLTGGGAAPIDITIDDVSAKLITPDPYVEMVGADEWEFWFTLPGSPVGGEEVHMFYRVQDSNDAFFDCWDAYIRRNDANTQWDFRLDSIASGTRTNRRSATNVGNVDGIKIVNPVGDHLPYTKIGDTYTQQGATIANTTHQSETGYQCVWSSTVTPVRKRVN